MGKFEIPELVLFIIVVTNLTLGTLLCFKAIATTNHKKFKKYFIIGAILMLWWVVLF